ncbi:ATP-dependent translocase ABCB1-like isoform X2 [Rhopilema esculentum]|uniref:ATP-dependent translocase ABCB1-like isoform X2 n=1 Tax=Rhopilema esculentum TaxID=499914 RepID=UPI0031DF2191
MKIKGDRKVKPSEKEDSSSKFDNKEKEKKEKDEKQPQVSLIKLFRHADITDIFLMVIGTIFAIGNGIAQPLTIIMFGDLIGDFVKYGEQQYDVSLGLANATSINFDIEGQMVKFAEYYSLIGFGCLLAAYVHTAFWSLSGVRQANKIRKLCFKEILKKDIGWFDQIDAGELSTRITEDVTKVQNGIGDKFGMLIHSVAMFVAAFIIGFVYSWRLTLVLLALTPLVIITTAITGFVISKLTSQEQAAYAKAGGVAEEVFSSIRTVVAFGGEKRELQRYTACLGDSQKAGIRKGLNSGLAFGLFQLVTFCSYAVAFWYGAELIIDGIINEADVMIVFFCIIVGATQIGQAAPNIQDIANAKGAAYYIYDLMDHKCVINSMSTEGETPPVNGNIEFKDIHFRYPSRKEIKILDGFSLKIDSGSTVALVGESGCGKSTIVKLVQRFYDPEEGLVCLDGNDLRKINLRYLRSQIGVVSQEPVLFEGTITENIRLGKRDATDDEIKEAAVDANAHRFISELPKGYDTQVGEGGAQLSGGQKQRIAIARALVRKPKILLLDEATSALDTESESIVQAALEQASQGRTTIVIAHRLSTVRNADMIVAMRDGVVMETGTHDDLMSRKDVYYKLVMLQTIAEEVENEADNISVLSNEEKALRLAEKISRKFSVISQTSETSADEIVKLEKTLQKQYSRQHTQREEKHVTKKKEEPEEEIEEEVEIPPLSRIMKLSITEWPYLALGSVFAGMAGAFPVGFAVIISEIIKIFSFKSNVKEMRSKAEFWSLMFVVLGVGSGVAILVSSYLFSVAGEILTRRLRELLFQAILRQDISFFDEPTHSTGALSARLASDASGVQGATSIRLSTLVQVVVMGLSAIIVSFVYSWKLTLLIFAFIPFLLLAGAMYTSINTSFAAKEKETLVQASAVASETTTNIRTVASLGVEEFFFDRYVTLLSQPYKKAQYNSHFFGVSFGMSYAIWFLVNAAAFRLGGHLVVRNEVDFADMFKVVFALVFAAMFAGQVASFAPNYLKAKVSAARIFKLLDLVPPIDSYSESGEKPDTMDGSVSFNEVQFSYPSRPNVTVLKSLSVEVMPGETLALVGPSGCGKSTTVSLIERFYDVATGAVKLGGLDVRNLNLGWLRSQIGYVAQEPVLFNCSIRDNIAYGLNDEERKSIEQAEIEAVAMSANIHHFIASLPNGYDTLVGEKGTLISGGQKQRIAIARALIRNPKLLLLDEATSALDSESEKVVQDALDVAMEGRTSIIIAHRLSTVQNADVIAVVENGKIIEAGSHAELMEKKGAYYVLNSGQF